MAALNVALRLLRASETIIGSESCVKRIHGVHATGERFSVCVWERQVFG